MSFRRKLNALYVYAQAHDGCRVEFRWNVTLPWDQDDGHCPTSEPEHMTAWSADLVDRDGRQVASGEGLDGESALSALLYKLGVKA